MEGRFRYARKDTDRGVRIEGLSLMFSRIFLLMIASGLFAVVWSMDEQNHPSDSGETNFSSQNFPEDIQLVEQDVEQAHVNRSLPVSEMEADLEQAIVSSGTIEGFQFQGLGDDLVTHDLESLVDELRTCFPIQTIQSVDAPALIPTFSIDIDDFETNEGNATLIKPVVLSVQSKEQRMDRREIPAKRKTSNRLIFFARRGNSPRR